MEMFLKIAPGVACLLFWLHSLGKIESLEEEVVEMRGVLVDAGLIPEKVED